MILAEMTRGRLGGVLVIVVIVMALAWAWRHRDDD